jgi:D-alanine-D-alanine ligase
MKPMKVGLAYNVKRRGGDEDAEYDSPETIDAIKKALESLGHRVLMWEAVPELARTVDPGKVEIVFNMAEGTVGRNREAHVPALLEFLGIPFTGSDSATMMLTLDKALTKKIVRFAGVNTPNYKLVRNGSDKIGAGMLFPLMVKPNAEGSSKGITDDSVVEDMAALWRQVRSINENYRQPALVEEFLPGREFTVGILGNGKDLRFLPIMEIEFLEKDVAHPTYNYRIKQDWKKFVRYHIPAVIEPPLTTEIQDLCGKAFRHLMCRDVARIDVRLDAAGKPHLIEVNPLPGLSPGYSDLVFIAEAAGTTHTGLVGAILENALRRYGMG